MPGSTRFNQVLNLDQMRASAGGNTERGEARSRRQKRATGEGLLRTAAFEAQARKTIGGSEGATAGRAAQGVGTTGGSGAAASAGSLAGAAAITAPLLFTPLAIIPLGILFLQKNVLTGRRRRDHFRLPKVSPTYSFDIIRTSVEIGTPIPVIYGKNRVGGQIIQAESRGSPTDANETLYMLIALGWGRLQSIGTVAIDTDNIGNTLATLLVNNNPGTEKNNIDLSIRMGSNTQSFLRSTAIPVATTPTGDTLLSGAGITKTTINTPDFVGVKIQFAGLYNLNKRGAYPANVEFSIDIQPAGGGASVFTQNFTIEEENAAIFNITRTFGPLDLTPANYDIILTRVSPDEAFQTPLGKSATSWVDYTEIGGDRLSHPNFGLMEVSALGTVEFNGKIPDISVVVEGKHVPISIDGVTAPLSYSTNPAWIALDIITNKLYGLGRVFDLSKVDLISFIAWADYCDELVSGTKRFTFNAVYDEPNFLAWDALLQVCDIGHAFPTFSNQKLGMVIDRARPATAMFGMGVIKDGSFGLQYKDLTDVPDAINITYFDEALEFEKDTVEFRVGDPTNSTYNVRKVSKIGITNKPQATREAKYILEVGQKQKRSVSFNVVGRALNVVAGDRIEVSHDVPAWGYSGLVLTTNSTVDRFQIDRDLTVVALDEVTVYHLEDDTLETRVIATAPGDYVVGDFIDVTVSFTIPPAKYAQYATGAAGINTKPFVVDNITYDNDMEFSIQATEYNEAIYDDTFDLDTITYSRFPIDGKTPNDVENLEAIQISSVRRDGTNLASIGLFWQYPDYSTVDGKPRAQLVEVYIRETGSTFWKQIGVQKYPFTNFKEFNQLISGTTYELTVVPVSHSGDKKSPDATPTVSLIYTGITNKPEDISGARITDEGDRVSISWNELTDTEDLQHYEIRRGTGWHLADITAKTGSTSILVDKWHVGINLYMIRAKAFSENYSGQAGVVNVEKVGRGVEALARAEHDLTWPGTLTNLTINGDNHLQITGGVAGSYESPIIDSTVPAAAPSRRDARLNISALQDVPLETWTTATYSWDSETAQCYAWDGILNEIHTTIKVSIRYSLDNITFTAYFETFELLDIENMRYIQYKIEVTTDDLATYFPLIREVTLNVGEF